MLNVMILFGPSGDLAGRYLLPALAELQAAGRLPEDFTVIGAGRRNWNDAQFRQMAAERLGEHAAHVPAAAREAMVAALRYRQVDLDDPGGLAGIIDARDPVAAYLALPPRVFPAAVSALGAAGLAAGSRIVVEKPFGEDLESAAALNRLLAEFGDERTVFRVDHFLGMSTVQNLLGARLANRILEPIWNSTHVAEIDIVWEETLALEGRASYYDGTGALRDMIQNHLLQVLCLVAMEPPASLGERDLRDRKVDVLRAVRPLSGDDAASTTRRARYGAGWSGNHEIPAYADEDGVDPGRGTETFAEVVLELDSWRWAGTRFRLRTGKALARDRREVRVRFRPVPHLPFDLAEAPQANELRFSLDPERLTLALTGTGPGARFSLVPLELSAELARPELSAYSRLLLDVFEGGTALSIRGDEAEEAWRVVTPVLHAWGQGRVPLEEYPAGSDGPAGSAP